MPDFSAISAAITAVTNAISGLVTLTGSIDGTATLEAFNMLGSSIGAEA